MPEVIYTQAGGWYGKYTMDLEAFMPYMCWVTSLILTKLLRLCECVKGRLGGLMLVTLFKIMPVTPNQRLETVFFLSYLNIVRGLKIRR